MKLYVYESPGWIGHAVTPVAPSEVPEAFWNMPWKWSEVVSLPKLLWTVTDTVSPTSASIVGILASIQSDDVYSRRVRLRPHPIDTDDGATCAIWGSLRDLSCRHCALEDLTYCDPADTKVICHRLRAYQTRVSRENYEAEHRVCHNQACRGDDITQRDGILKKLCTDALDSA
jgi:hypothetical protein